MQFAQMSSTAALDGAISAFDTSKPVANFSPGPAPMPTSVMDEIQKEMLDYRGTSISVLSMSHRSPEFGAIIDDCRSVLRRVLRLPESHEILFTHGGGHGQFAAVPLNMCPGGPNGSSADYFVHGSWGRRAAAEERRRIAHASEWLESEPPKLPSLIQDAWEWAQPAATSPGAAREETVTQGLR